MPLYRRVGFRVAAVLAPLLVVTAVLVATLTDSQPQTDNLISLVVPSEGQIIELPDGSRVEAKPGTTIAYADNFAENRSVTLVGEAFFSVVKDEQHPFTVEGGAMKVTVHGTEFNVRAYENDADNEVVLASGKVSVAVLDKTITLAPMQRLRVDRTDNTIELDEIRDGQLLKLRGQVLNFNNVPIYQAFALLGDYYGVHINFAGGVNLTDEVVMTFDEATTLEDALAVLQIALPKFTYTIDGDTITISPK